MDAALNTVDAGSHISLVSLYTSAGADPRLLKWSGESIMACVHAPRINERDKVEPLPATKTTRILQLNTKS